VRSGNLLDFFAVLGVGLNVGGARSWGYGRFSLSLSLPLSVSTVRWLRDGFAMVSIRVFGLRDIVAIASGNLRC